jgi:hypothetical protein
MEATERCPWCDSVISRARFLDIEARIRAEEENKLSAREKSIRTGLEKKYAAEYEKQRVAAEKRWQAEASKAVAKVVAERDAAVMKIKEVEGRESNVRKQAREDAEKAISKKLQSLTAERDEAAKKAKDAEGREADLRKELKAEAEKVTAKELQKQREILEKDRDSALLKQQAGFHRVQDSLQKKVKILERQLQNKTSNQLGDGAEIDLYDKLRAAFPDDHIKPVPKGKNGADIIQDVTHKGQRCGRILIDCKNRQAWQHGFVSKLRQDQIEAEAEYAILASNVFPSGKKQLCVESDVIVVSPAAVIHIVELLRKWIITLHLSGLSMKHKEDKKEHLYKLITSDSYSRRLTEATRLTEKILDLDVDEQKAHSIVWRNRGVLTKQLGNILRTIDTEVAAVIEGGPADEARLPIEAKLPQAAIQRDQKREAI